MDTTHWGEIPKEDTNDFVPDVTEDIEKSMSRFCLSEYEDEEFLPKNERIQLPPMDPLMLHTIALHKYCNDMTEMIRVAELATEMNVLPSEDAAPPIPEMPEIEIKHKKNSLNFIPKDFTPFSTGCDVEVPDLSEAIVKQILTKCVVIMFAHIGYETTHQSVLDVLVDVLETFFTHICHKVKVAVEDEEKGHGTGFPHIIERVLTETGMGGIKGLNDYYQCRVVKYTNILQGRCKELNDSYASLLIPKSPSPIDSASKIVKVKVEEEEDILEVENPELHFTTIDGEVCSTLEPGYQLLNSLEAAAHLQSLADAEDDIECSPGVVSIPSESDICNFSPFTKKKRLK